MACLTVSGFSSQRDDYDLIMTWVGHMIFISGTSHYADVRGQSPDWPDESLSTDETIFMIMGIRARNLGLFACDYALPEPNLDDDRAGLTI